MSIKESSTYRDRFAGAKLNNFESIYCWCLRSMQSTTINVMIATAKRTTAKMNTLTCLSWTYSGVGVYISPYIYFFIEQYIKSNLQTKPHKNTGA